MSPMHIQIEGTLSLQSISCLNSLRGLDYLMGSLRIGSEQPDWLAGSHPALFELCILTLCKQELFNFIYTFNLPKKFL